MDLTFDDMKLISNSPIVEKISKNEAKISNAVDTTFTCVKAEEVEDVRSYNVGDSDYSKHSIQPWQIWIEYQLNPFDADIVKRVLRHKKSQSRREDYEKIIHICKERIRQIDAGVKWWDED